MNYNCPICGTQMSESNFFNTRICKECPLSVDVKVLDAIAAKDAHIAELAHLEAQMGRRWHDAEERYEAHIVELEKKLNSAVKRMEYAIKDGENAGLKLSPLRKFVQEYK